MRSMPKPQSIRVLSWHGRWGDALAEAVSRPFTQATGIEVEPVLHVGPRLPDGLVCALENSSAAPVDVVWCNTAAALPAAKQGWCESLQRLEVLSELRDRARLQAYPEWPVAQAYVVQHVLVYRTCLYPGAAPQTWRALFDPRHAGRVALSPGGNGFYPVAQVLGGGQPERIPMDLSPCWSTVAKLRPQLRQPDYSSGLEASIAQGQIDLCYSALPDALAFRASGLDVDWTVPREGVADTTDALWVPRGRSPERRVLGPGVHCFRAVARYPGTLVRPAGGAADERARGDALSPAFATRPSPSCRRSVRCAVRAGARQGALHAGLGSDFRCHRIRRASSRICRAACCPVDQAHRSGAATES